jgi:hypothetical protein
MGKTLLFRSTTQLRFSSTFHCFNYYKQLIWVFALPNPSHPESPLLSFFFQLDLQQPYLLYAPEVCKEGKTQSCFMVEGEMRKLAFISCFLLILVGMSSGAQALSIGGNGAWISWTASDVNNDGTPYWDNLSWDGTYENIGYWMSNTGVFPSGTPSGSGVMPYYGNTNGTGASNIYFTNHGPVTVEMVLEIAGYANSNTFGWFAYDPSNPTAPIVLHQIFPGPYWDPVVFFSTLYFGFYLQGPGGTFLSLDNLSPNTDPGNQHFAVFNNGSQTYWFGIEDWQYLGGDKDFNDMVVKIGPVPEPASLLLLGTGLIGLAVLRRKYKA